MNSAEYFGGVDRVITKLSQWHHFPPGPRFSSFAKNSRFLWPLSSQASTPSAQLKLYVSGQKELAAAEVKWKAECLRVFKERMLGYCTDDGYGYRLSLRLHDKYIFFVTRKGDWVCLEQWKEQAD